MKIFMENDGGQIGIDTEQIVAFNIESQQKQPDYKQIRLFLKSGHILVFYEDVCPRFEDLEKALIDACENWIS